MTLSLAFLSEVAKFIIFPIVGVVWAFGKSKIAKIESDIERNRKNNAELREKIVHLEAVAVTSDKLETALNSLLAKIKEENTNLEVKFKSENSNLEKSIMLLLDNKLELFDAKLDVMTEKILHVKEVARTAQESAKEVSHQVASSGSNKDY